MASDVRDTDSYENPHIHHSSTTIDTGTLRTRSGLRAIPNGFTKMAPLLGECNGGVEFSLSKRGSLGRAGWALGITDQVVGGCAKTLMTSPSEKHCSSWLHGVTPLVSMVSSCHKQVTFV